MATLEAPMAASVHVACLAAEPESTSAPFDELPDYRRMQLASENRVINTDAYNRTMEYLRDADGWRQTETYVLQMRRAPHGYLVAAGIEDCVQELTDQPLTQSEVDLAADFYRQRNIPFFNKDIWQAVVDEHSGKLPIEVHGALDGTVVLPGEPVLRVSGPGELVAHFEHLFHRPFYDTLVATKAHRIQQIVGDPSRFIEVGKRSTPDERIHLRAVKAMQVGGRLALTSNDAGAAVFAHAQPVGTLGHRYVQRFLNEELAFRHAVGKLDSVSLLVDLVDTYQGIETVLKLKQEYRMSNKKIWARLDSGDVRAQTRHYLDACTARGFTDPVLDKVVVEGLESIEEIADIEASLDETEKQRVVYGAGGLLVGEGTTRSCASTGFKLAEYEDALGTLQPTMKFSNSPGKHSLPGRPTIAMIAGRRAIVQIDEASYGEDLLPLLYRPGYQRPTSDTLTANARCQEQYAQLAPLIASGQRAAVSPKTEQKISQVMQRYSIEASGEQ